jgi:hypothetical protein
VILTEVTALETLFTTTVKALACGAVALSVSSYVIEMELPLLEVCGVPATGGEPSTCKRSEFEMAT